MAVGIINRGITVQDQNKSFEINREIKDDKKFIPKQYQKVAENMEQQFAEYMLSQMNKTVEDSSDNEENSAGMDFYKGLKTTEQAKIMSQKNQLGVQEIILDQIYPKRLRNEFALKQYEAQADRIHHNLPKLDVQRKNDTIKLGKNDSSSDQTAGGIK